MPGIYLCRIICTNYFSVFKTKLFILEQDEEIQIHDRKWECL